MMLVLPNFSFFFFNDTATTEIYTLSLHDALPICRQVSVTGTTSTRWSSTKAARSSRRWVECTTFISIRSEEHTSELQSPCNLVCRLLLEKKKNKTYLSALQRNRTSIIQSRLTHTD